MKKIAAIMAVLTAICVGTATAQKRVTFEDSDIKITSKLGPQYIGTRIYAGDAGATTLYYQVSAIVTGVGETLPTTITVSNANAVMSSTNSIQLLWSKVPEATSYNIYKATAANVYRLVTNVDSKTQGYIDTGVEGGALYVASTKPGGNLNVENNLVVGGDATIANLTVTGTLSPYSTGTFTAEDVTVEDDLVVGDDLTVGGLATIGETLTVTGNTMLGAANYKSTMTASNGNWAITGNVVSAAAVQGATVTGTTSVSGAKVSVTAGPLTLYSRTQAQIEAFTPAAVGEVYYCNDCTATSVCVSSAAAVMSWVSVVNPATACD